MNAVAQNTEIEDDQVFACAQHIITSLTVQSPGEFHLKNFTVLKQILSDSSSAVRFPLNVTKTDDTV